MVATLYSLLSCSVFGSWGLLLFVCAASWLNHIKEKTKPSCIQAQFNIAEYTKAPEF